MPTLQERIIEHLRTNGAALDDNELADALGVPKPDIAETCRRLETQGLVVHDMAGGIRLGLKPAQGSEPAPAAPTEAPKPPAFPDHARRVLSARWGTTLQRRMALLPGGEAHPFELVSGNGRIVGDVVWLAGRGRTDEATSAAISEAVLIVSHVVNAVRRFLVFNDEWDAVNRWASRYRLLLDGVELWFLDGDRLQRLA